MLSSGIKASSALWIIYPFLLFSVSLSSTNFRNFGSMVGRHQDDLNMEEPRRGNPNFEEDELRKQLQQLQQRLEYYENPRRHDSDEEEVKSIPPCSFFY